MELKPKEVDELLATKVMGYETAPSHFSPTTDPVAALSVLRKMQSDDWELEARMDVSRGAHHDIGLWSVDVDSNAKVGKGGSLEYEFAWALSKALAEFFISSTAEDRRDESSSP